MEIKNQQLRRKFSRMGSDELLIRIQNKTSPNIENKVAIEVAEKRFNKPMGAIIDLKVISIAELTKMLKDIKLQRKYKKRFDKITKDIVNRSKVEGSSN